MPDIFDEWFSKLPKERQFSASPIPESHKPAYEQWKKAIGFNETPDYDLPGAFLSGMLPDKNNHLASFGRNGKLLKSPNHPTSWMTSFTELYHEYAGVYPEIGELSREEAAEIIKELAGGNGY